MKKFVCRTLWMLFSLLCIAVALPSWAQDSTTRVTVDILQGRIAAAQESGQLDDAGKARLIDLYRQSISNLQTADANQAAFEDYRQVLRTAPAETERLRVRNDLRSQGDPLASLDTSATVPVAQLVRTLDEELANQTAVEAKLAVLEARLESDAARLCRPAVRAPAGDHRTAQGHRQEIPPGGYRDCVPTARCAHLHR